MTKTQITKVGNYWRLTYYQPTRNGLVSRHIFYPYPDGAFYTWLNMEKYIILQQKAWAKLKCINMQLLSVHETKFIKGLQQSGCVPITKRQYGYLTGILERQQGV